MLHCRRVSVILCTLLGAGTCAAQTITVNTLEDATDFGGAQRVANLPGPDGRVSMREAVIAVNNTPGPQTIGFAVAPTEFWLVPGMGLLKMEVGLWALDDDGTTIDFTTQTAAHGDTNPDGAEIGVYGLEPNAWGVAAIYINGDNCVIKGMGDTHMRGNAVRIVGNNNRVIGCDIEGPWYGAIEVSGFMGGPIPTGNVVGGTGPGEGNRLIGGGSGVDVVAPVDSTVVIGNYLSGSSAGVGVTGATQYGLAATNTRIGGPTEAERNVINGAGHYGEEGFPTGTQVDITDADGVIVENNYIGIDADGAPVSQRGPGGVAVTNSRGVTVRDNTIGAIAVNGTNHYAGQRFGIGILVQGKSVGTQVQGNFVGVDAFGGPIPNRSGIMVAQRLGSELPTLTTVGGTTPGAANTVAFNETFGVAVGAIETGALITGNSIHDNGGLGIDLLPFGATTYGVTPNDAGDADTGGNNLQNFPVITNAFADMGGTTISGTINTVANAALTIEFFSSPMCDASGNGEGKVYLGSVDATTNGSGNASFTTNVAADVASGHAVTATATRLATRDTSEFSACFVVESGACGADYNGTGEKGDILDFLDFMDDFGGCENQPGPCGGIGNADLNGDTLVDILDFLDFMDAFGTGC